LSLSGARRQASTLLPAPVCGSDNPRETSNSDPELGSRLCHPVGSSIDEREEDEEYEDAQHHLSPRNLSPQAQSLPAPTTIENLSTLVATDPGPSHRPTTGVSLRTLRANARSRGSVTHPLPPQPRAPVAYDIWGFPQAPYASDGDASISPLDHV
jgi:hypothetical protein